MKAFSLLFCLGMESRQESPMDEYDQAQKGVPEGAFRCPYCSSIFSYEPIDISAAPDSPVMCYDCLPDDVKAAYDSFQRKDEVL